MSADIKAFTGNTTNALERAPYAIRELARDFAKAWEVGYRVALNDANIDPLVKARMLSEQHAAYEIRVNLYEAMIRAQMRGGLRG